MKRISEDVSNGVYHEFYLNFTSNLPRALLEQLAQQVGPCHSRIARVYDQYMSFECLEPRLFCLPGAQNADPLLRLLWSKNTNEQVIEDALDKQAAGLLSVMVSVGGQPPLIASVIGGAGESVAVKLDLKLRNLLQSIKSNSLGPSLMSVDDMGLQRPLVLILDRTFDLATPLRHSSSYAGLIVDVFGLEHNRCVYMDEKSEKKAFTVDTLDEIWEQNAARPFPQVAEAVDEALKKYKLEHDAITTKQGREDLKLAVQVLPELTERKRIIDSHLMLCQALLTAIKNRQLGEYFALEQRLDKVSVQNWLASKDSPGTMADKLRLFLLVLLLKCGGSKTGEEQWERDCAGFLKELDAEGKISLEAVKKYLEFNRTVLSSLSASPVQSPKEQPDQNSEYILSKLSRAGGGIWSNLTAGMKSLVGEAFEPPLVKQVEHILDHICTGSQSPPISANLKLLDPKLPRGQSANVGGGRSSVSHLVIYMLGGLTRTEYDACVAALPPRHPHLSVSVGGSELLSPSLFLSSLV